MEIYYFLRGSLAWTVTVAGLWPFNVPLVALAFRISTGQNPIRMPRQEYWLRCTLAAFVVALLTALMVGVDYFLAESVGFPAGPVHMIVFMAYVPAAMWVLFVLFALDDLVQALSVFAIYIYLPVVVLYLLNLVVPVWQPLLDWVNGWLKVPT